MLRAIGRPSATFLNQSMKNIPRYVRAYHTEELCFAAALITAVTSSSVFSYGRGGQKNLGERAIAIAVGSTAISALCLGSGLPIISADFTVAIVVANQVGFPLFDATTLLLKKYPHGTKKTLLDFTLKSGSLLGATALGITAGLATDAALLLSGGSLCTTVAVAGILTGSAAALENPLNRIAKNVTKRIVAKNKK